MQQEKEVEEFLDRHLQSILENDLDTYHETTSNELTLYEWFVTPHRIDGLPFHDFMMESNAARGTVFGAAKDSENLIEKSKTRLDLANLKIQCYDQTAIASYTLLISTSLQTGVQVVSHNESRIMVKDKNGWKVVHVHKSPAWKAPQIQP